MQLRLVLGRSEQSCSKRKMAIAKAEAIIISVCKISLKGMFNTGSFMLSYIYDTNNCYTYILHSVLYVYILKFMSNVYIVHTHYIHNTQVSHIVHTNILTMHMHTQSIIQFIT